MKVLNLYAGIGGNRKLWPDTLPNGEKVEITAVEIDPQIAECYKRHFPNDTVITGDAHQYLLEHFKEFDFIWSSPPCQSHSFLNFINNGKSKGKAFRYPELNLLYGEIILLKTFFFGQFVVENVRPYYTPLICPDFCLGRHFFWSNKMILENGFKEKRKAICGLNITELEEVHGFKLPAKLNNKRQILRNCVAPELGKYVFQNVVGVNK